MIREPLKSIRNVALDGKYGYDGIMRMIWILL